MLFLRERSYWASVALTSYAGASAFTRSLPGERVAPAIGLSVVPLILALGYAATAPPTRSADRVEPAARAAARTAITGAAVVVVSLTARDSVAALTFLGAALASVAGLIAVARARSLGGLLTPPPFSRRLDSAVVAAFVWAVAVAIAVAAWVSPERTSSLPLASAYAGAAASIASTSLLLLFAARALVARRLELGVSERLGATLWVGGASLAIGIAASALGLSPPEKMLPVVATAVGLIAGAAAALQRAERVSEGMRHALALLLLSTPPALGAAFVAKVSPERAALAVIAACAACALVGMSAPRIARRAAPERHLWLDALDAATRAAMSPDPEPALEEALLALRPLSGHARAAIAKAQSGSTSGLASSPTLFRLTPPEAITADRAGFVHRESALVPESLLALAGEEPDRVLRTDVLEAVSVRRPDVRPALSWLTDRGIGAAAILAEREEPIGVLALPQGDRTVPLALEEVRALRTLADRLAAVVAVSAKLTRSWDRERIARETTEDLERRTEGLTHALSEAEARIEDILAMVAKPAKLATYSPASRTAVERIQSLARTDAPITLLTALGIDSLAYASLCHLDGPRPGGPFVIADGGSKALTDLMLWRADATSPVAKARSGTLVLLHPELLPKLVQSYIGAAADERVRLVVVVARTLDVLVAQADLDERFADRIGDRVVGLPTLAARAEDLRALALAHLGEIGSRFHGRPLGIEAQALGMLAEHMWPGNDAELVGVLTRAAAGSDGHMVRRRDIVLAIAPARSALGAAS